MMLMDHFATGAASPMDWLGRPDRIALFLDLDGTLIDIAGRPDAVGVPAGLVDLLEGLREVHGGALAIVTGRRIDEVDRLLAPARFVAAGVHGAEFRTDPTEIVRPAALPLAADVVDALTRLERIFPGVRVEVKGPSAAVHWRDTPDGAPYVAAEIERILEAGPDHLVVQPGRKVFEIVPKHVSKGAALEILCRLEAFAGRRPIMIGDDVTDESAIAAAEALGGAGFRVEGETFPAELADFSSPRRVREWLSLLLARAR